MPARPAADRCPGVLRPHRAEDGLLVRLRIPGGQTTSTTLAALAQLAGEFGLTPGPGTLQLTSRGNLQLRGIDEARLAELTEHIYALGLLPSLPHDRVRNIVASPLTGLTEDRPDLRPLVRELDGALCTEPALAELPGRFLFALDDGRGDVSALTFDLGYRAIDDEQGWLVLGGDPPRGGKVSRAAAVAEIIGVALDFVRARASEGSGSWRVWETPGLRPDLAALATPTAAADATIQVRLGAVAGAASVSVPLAFLTVDQAQVVDEVAAGGPVVITPWRGLVIPGAADWLTRLAEHGLVVDDDDAWSRITACVGAPGCAKSRISTRELARSLADHPATTQLDQPVHLSGCERRCGAPAVAHHELVAPVDLDQALHELALR